MKRVAYQGEPGAYGEVAALQLGLGAGLPEPTFAAVIDAVTSGRAARGVLPLENVIAGVVHASVAVLTRAQGVRVVGEVVVPVQLCVMAIPGVSLADIRELTSHEVALMQCRRFLGAHRWIRPRAVSDTAGAARHVSEGRSRSVAALASQAAARRYGLELLAVGVEDRPDNATRFAVIARYLPDGRGTRPSRTAVHSSLRFTTW
jgi:prephenate dehydratase